MTRTDRAPAFRWDLATGLATLVAAALCLIPAIGFLAATLLIGIVTTTDLLDLIGRGVERPVAHAKRWTLKHRGPRRRGPVRT